MGRMSLRGRFEKSRPSVCNEKPILCTREEGKDILGCVIWPENYILCFLFYLHEKHLSITSSSLNYLVDTVH